MPSFDIVSELDMHEVTNGLDQANREIETRFDFKGTNCRFERKEKEITIFAQQAFQLKQLLEILEQRLVKRGIDILSIDAQNPEVAIHEARQKVILKEGIDQKNSKEIIKLIKDSKIKVQAAIQGEKVRVTGKKRDDLQECIAMLRQAKLEVPLQFDNFRD